MRDRPLLLLLLLLALLALFPDGCGALSKRRVRIDVYRDQYLKDVRVGSPGKFLTLRMRWDLNQTYLYDDPGSYSETFTKDGRELFFFSAGIEPVRLRVVYGQEPSQTDDQMAPYYNGARRDTSGGVTYHGVLGLGDSSELWSTWTEYTVSKFSLSLGGDDSVDVLTRAKVIGSTNQDFVSHTDIDGAAFSYPLGFELSEEFTYLPQVIFPNVTRALENGSRIALRAEGNLEPSPGGPRLLLWLSTESSIITTSLGGVEDSLRLSEKEGKNASRIIIGRIQLMEDFVVHRDFVRNVIHVRPSFDTFPQARNGQFPQAAMAVLTVLLWFLWNMVTTPSVYQWLAYGTVPHQKAVIAHLKKIGKNAEVFKAFQHGGSAPAPAPAAAPARRRIEEARIGEDILASAILTTRAAVQQASRISLHERVLKSGPVDWTLIRCLIFLTRLVAFWTFYIAVWGYRSGRFAARLAALSGYSQDFGVAIFWMVLVYSLAMPFLVNIFFIRRFTQAGTILVSTSLMASLWINMLPATQTAAFIALLRNLFIAAVVSIDIFSWPFWALLRGPDAAISDRVTDAKEFLPETAYVDQAVLPVTRGPDPDLNLDEGPSAPPPDGSAERARRSRYEVGEILLLFAWVLVVEPVSIIWLIVTNFVPFINSEMPNSGVESLAAAAFVFVVIYFAYATPLRVCIQIYKNASNEYREGVRDIFAKALAKTEKDE